MQGLSRRSAWSSQPMICSLWFRYREGRLLCATKDDSTVARRLREDPRCGFELAPNEPPYFGVRGRGRASISSDGAIELLGELIDRYLGGRDSELATWLLGNAENEVTISIEPEGITSWDYSSRMSPTSSGSAGC